MNIYEAIVKNILAIPVIKGTKTESEKFAGAVNTSVSYTHLTLPTTPYV